MNTLNKKQAESYIRKCAASVGLTFKKSNTRLSGQYLWKLIERKSGETVMDNYQFASAYNDACSGYIESWNSDKQIFDGIDREYQYENS